MSEEPQRLGKYELREHVAQGGMGTVWKAFDTQLQRYVAVKILHVGMQHNPDVTRRFEREAQLLAALHHPNIIQIHDFQFAHPPDTTVSYMVMDYIQGGTMADYIRNTARKQQFPPPGDIVSIFTAVSLALDYAHQKGLIHRDIKPANILLDQQQPLIKSIGNPILTDFGIARVQGAPAGTAIGTFLGTPHYISPEQAQGKYYDKRSDLYSLGVILYEMLTGVTPFRGDTPMAILIQHLYATPTPPALINTDISLALSAMIMRSIAKDPEARFPSAAAMAIALVEALNMPVPRSLLAPTTPGVQLTSPSPSAPISPTSPGTLKPSTPSPLSFTPTQEDIPTPSPTLASAPTVRTDPSSSSSYPPGVPQQSEHTPKVAPKRSKKLAMLLVGLIVVLVISAGGGAFALFFHNRASTSNTVVGHIRFIGSPHSLPGSYDEVQLDLQNITDPQPGYAYYAWIEAASLSSEKEVAPHWQLALHNGAIHTSPLTYRTYSTLLFPNSILLITEEQSQPPPSVYSTGLYYARITQTSSTTFDIMPCPSNAVSTVCSAGQ